MHIRTYACVCVYCMYMYVSLQTHNTTIQQCPLYTGCTGCRWWSTVLSLPLCPLRTGYTVHTLLAALSLTWSTRRLDSSLDVSAAFLVEDRSTLYSSRRLWWRQRLDKQDNGYIHYTYIHTYIHNINIILYIDRNVRVYRR